MFDRYAAATAPSWGRRALVLASITIHISAAIGLVVYSICRIEEIPPPPLPITFLSPPRPSPPPPAGSTRPKASHSAPRKPSVTASIAPSVVVEPRVPDEPASSNEAPGETSAPSGPAGVPDGKPDGEIAAHGTTPAKIATAPVFVLMAAAIRAPDPHLTDEFKNSHAGQSVSGAYRLCLATDGHVTDVSVIASVPAMDDLITSHIKSTWQFKPQPLPVCFTKPFKFNIK